MSGPTPPAWTPADLINVRTRTGKKVHVAFPTSSVTLCGRWLRVTASRMKVSGAATCEHCTPVQARMIARAAQENEDGTKQV